MGKHTKQTVEDCLSIDSRSMYKNNALNHGAAGTWAWHNSRKELIASLRYQCQNRALTLLFDAGGMSYQQSIQINTTPCNYGNHRYWFLCPGQDCGKRVAKLYLVNSQFHCRHCHKLNYLIQQCNKDKVAHLNMQRMRVKLGWPLSGEIPFFRKIYKPLNKNLKTFKAMVAKHDAYEAEANAVRVNSFRAFLKSVGEEDRLNYFD